VIPKKINQGVSRRNQKIFVCIFLEDTGKTSHKIQYIVLITKVQGR